MSTIQTPSPRSDAPDDHWVIDVLQSLQTIHAKYAVYAREVTEVTGLSVPQVLCLQAIREREAEEVTGAQVATRIGMSHATVSRLLVRLEAENWVVRKRGDRDRRKVGLKLTAAGKRKLKRVPSILKVRQMGHLTVLQPREQQRLTKHLNEVLRLLGVGPIAREQLLDDQAKPT